MSHGLSDFLVNLFIVLIWTGRLPLGLDSSAMRALTNAAAAPRYGRLLETAIIAASQAPFVLKSSALNQRIPAAYNGTRWSSSNPGKNDFYSRQAKVKNLKSRAAFKLLEMDSKYKIFKRGQTVVDLGYAPGSWSQVALDRTKPNGRVVGIDIIPAQPPKGVSTIQGDFLSPVVQNMTKEYLIDLAQQGRAPDRDYRDDRDVETLQYREVFVTEKPSYIDTERAESIDSGHEASPDVGKLVDVVLSDMSDPWTQTSGFSSRTLSNPYRLMNTSGMPFRDHAGSMDLCLAALQFASDTLRTGGHFVCKFYQGAEDKDLELKLKKMFGRVHREKPDSSRSESREAYFVALRRKGDVTFGDVSTS
ncbi:23S ribosomal RNA methyltransferase [Nemania sp. NC0429]|nr:23S ribosomal RNA methyltransferase [Nemania sp. NC0429]